MANNCEIAIKIIGDKANILKLFDEIPFYTDWTVDTCDTWDSDVAESSATFYGDCAWSITSSMLDGNNEEFNLLDRTRDLGLRLEAYGQEPGIGFEEHYYIDRGELLVSETADFQEHDLTMFDSRTEAEEALGFSISEEEWDEYQNGWLPHGGFGEWSFDYIENRGARK